MRMNLRMTSKCLHIYIDFLMACDLNLNRKFCSCKLLLRVGLIARINFWKGIKLCSSGFNKCVKKLIQNRFHHVNIENLKKVAV
jgi:hypothetical protein